MTSTREFDLQQRLNQLPGLVKHIQQSIDELRALSDVDNVISAHQAQLIAARLQQDVDRLTNLGREDA